MVDQGTINALEDERYQAEGDRQDAADLVMWSLRTVRQNSPSRFLQLCSAAASVGVTDLEELVDLWTDASRRYDDAGTRLMAAEGG